MMLAWPGLKGEPAVDLVLDTRCWLVGVHLRTAIERLQVRVPQFKSDGTVERGADSSAVLVDRVLERANPFVEAEGTTGDGTKRTWTRPGT